MAVPGPPDAFCAVYGRAQCITTTRFDGHHPTDKTQRISGPPGGPEIRQPYRRRSQRRFWGQDEPAPTTHGGYGRNTTGGWLADDPRVVPFRPRACGGSGAGFGVQEAGGNSSGGAMPSGEQRPIHRAGERSFLQLPSGGCKPSRKASSSLFKYNWQFVQHLLASTHSTSSDLCMRYAPVMDVGTGSEVGNLICRHRESGSRWSAYIATR